MLHRVVRESLATLYAAVEQGFASPLPSFVNDELEGYLACGVLARGFAILQCDNAECRQKKLAAFEATQELSGLLPKVGRDERVAASRDRRDNTRSEGRSKAAVLGRFGPGFVWGATDVPCSPRIPLHRSTSMDPIVQFKEMQKAAWSNFATLESITGTAAPRLVRFAGITAGAEVLDVACGTGVVALTAARLGARVTGVDLTPQLVARAAENAALMKAEAEFLQGDAEQLPVPDAKFDFVVSQFGHMFAPRPDVVIKEMLRVLKPGGTIAFATWPPELLTGRSFALMGKYGPPPPPGVSPPVQWGDPAVVRERLGTAVKDLTFTRDTMIFQTLSPQHFRLFMETNLGPAKKLLEMLDSSEPAKAASLRREMEELAAHYFENNTVRQDYLLSRAAKS